MNKEKEPPFFLTIISVLYAALVYLDCFSMEQTQTNQLKYGMIWILFLETTFVLLGKGYEHLWKHWIWMLRLAVIIADYFFLFTSYNSAGIGCYLVVQMFYWERLKKIETKNQKNLFIWILSMTIIFAEIGIYFENNILYILGMVYAFFLLRNLKTVWNYYLEGKRDYYFLALSLSFLFLCDTSILLNYFLDKEWIGNLIWCFYIPSQFVLAKYE